jgi:hypothetical protein
MREFFLRCFPCAMNNFQCYDIEYFIEWKASKSRRGNLKRVQVVAEKRYDCLGDKNSYG